MVIKKRFIKLPTSAVVGLLIIFITFLAYFRALRIGFLSDDYLLLSFAQYSPTDLSLFMVQSNLWTPFFRPFVLLTWKILYLIVKDFAPVYHLFNLLVHIINSLLVVLLASRISPDSRWIAFAAGLFFALLPTNVEAVVWLASMYDLLATCFYLSSLLCLISYWQNGRLWRYLLSLFFFQLCLWSKETSFSLPAVILLVALMLPVKPKWAKVFLGEVPFLLLLGINLLQRYLALNSIGGYPTASLELTTIWDRLAASIAMLLVPMQRTLYSVELRQISLLLAAGLVIAGLMAGRHQRNLLFSISWIVLTIFFSLPGLNHELLLEDSINARYLYLPAVGFSYGLASLIDACIVRWGITWQRWVTPLAIGIVSVLYLVMLQVQIHPWLVADREATRIAAELHKLLGDVRPGTVLHVANYPLFYKGASMYWMGLDAAMLQRYGSVFDWWMGELDEPIPYDRLNPKRDFYQVFLEFKPKQESWKVTGARGVTSKDSQAQLPANHWIFLMHGENKLGHVLSKRKNSTQPEEAVQWDFSGCAQAQLWIDPSGLSQCKVGMGLSIEPKDTIQKLRSPLVEIKSRGWAEVVVNLTTLQVSDGKNAVKLLWKTSSHESWRGQSLSLVELPPSATNVELHYFIPPRAKDSSIGQLQLEISVRGTPITISNIRFRTLN